MRAEIVDCAPNVNNPRLRAHALDRLRARCTHGPIFARDSGRWRHISWAS
jgi:hypothetical protein